MLPSNFQHFRLYVVTHWQSNLALNAFKVGTSKALDAIFPLVLNVFNTMRAYCELQLNEGLYVLKYLTGKKQYLYCEIANR